MRDFPMGPLKSMLTQYSIGEKNDKDLDFQNFSRESQNRKNFA